MTKVFIATPAYDGLVHVQYAVAFAQTVGNLVSHGQVPQFQMSVSGSLLVAERNKLLMNFLKTDCTHILCVDSDLGWPPNTVKDLLDRDEDVVGGVYPSRRDRQFMFRPKLNADNSLVINVEKRLIEMENIPAGFMLIKRHVIETLIATFPETYYKPKHGKGEHGYCLFNTGVIDGEFWGEDYIFCNYLRQAGFRIWVDPEIEFDHAGIIGSLKEVLTNKRPEGA